MEEKKCNCTKRRHIKEIFQSEFQTYETKRNQFISSYKSTYNLEDVRNLSKQVGIKDAALLSYFSKRQDPSYAGGIGVKGTLCGGGFLML